MYNLNDIFDFILSEVTQNQDEYFEDEEKFIKTSIEECIDSSDEEDINHIYQVIIDDLKFTINN
tara:strand:+ start:251 stop:442 length:192 start_codon:yes stop_codon:yes gene_type:complete